MAESELSIVIRAKNEAKDALDSLNEQFKTIGISMQDVERSADQAVNVFDLLTQVLTSEDIKLKISLFDDALEPAKALKNEIQKLFEQDIFQKIIISRSEENTNDTTTGSSGGNSGSDGVNLDPQFGDSAPIIEGSFASGITRVPYDMVARIHKDEVVLPVAEANQYRSGQMGSITMGDIHIYTQPGQVISRQVALEIRRELARIDRRVQ